MLNPYGARITVATLILLAIIYFSFTHPSVSAGFLYVAVFAYLMAVFEGGHFYSSDKLTWLGRIDLFVTILGWVFLIVYASVVGWIVWQKR